MRQRQYFSKKEKADHKMLANAAVLKIRNAAKVNCHESEFIFAIIELAIYDSFRALCPKTQAGKRISDKQAQRDQAGADRFLGSEDYALYCSLIDLDPEYALDIIGKVFCQGAELAA